MRRRGGAAAVSLPVEKVEQAPPDGNPGFRREAGPPTAVNVYWAGSQLVVLKREGDGRVTRTTQPAEHVSFLRFSDATPELRSLLRGSRHVLGVSEEDGKWLRVRWLTRDASKRAAEPGGFFDRRRVPVFEADVDPVRRWITDSGVELQRPRRVYLDFEADSRVPFAQMARMRILAWSLVSEAGDYRRAEVLAAEDDDAEAAMLRALWKALLDFDQVVSWNGDRFDFPLLSLRSEALGIAVEPRRWLWLDHMVVYERFDKASAGAEKQSMALGSVARGLLGEERTKLVKLGELGGPTSWGMWAAGEEERERLRLYCLDDADLMREIEERSGYLELLWSVAVATHTLPDTRCQNPTRYVEGFLLRLGRERGMHFPTWVAPAREGEQREGEESPNAPTAFKGAFNLEPTRRGILRDVHVCDFARLYPSIIVSWNMSPETYREDVVLVESAQHRPVYLSHLPLKRYPLPPGHCAAPLTERAFENDPVGVLALAVTEMLRLRKYWDDRKKGFAPGTAEWKDADRRSAAYKIAANAFFGVVGSPWSRFFVREVAEAIAQAGAWLLQQTIVEAESRGWKVVYGATDSLFVQGPTRAEFGRWVESLNEDFYPRLLRERGCARCTVKLEAEKGFDTLILVRKNGYAGKYAYFKGKDADADSEPEIKGFEYKRADAIPISRTFQIEVIDRLLGGEYEAGAYVELVERWRRRVLEEPLQLADVVQSKRLSKSVREYKRERKADGEWSARPPHVEVAAMLAERGQDVRSGVRIEFFVIDGSTSPAKYAPACDWTGEADRFAVWEACYPPTMRVLEACFPAVQWSRWERARPPKPRVAVAGVRSLFGDAEMRQRPLDASDAGAAKRKPAVSKRADVPSQRALGFGAPEEADAQHDGGDA